MQLALNLTHDQFNALVIAPVLIIVCTLCIIALIWACHNWWDWEDDGS